MGRAKNYPFGTGTFQRGGRQFDVGIHTRDFMRQVSEQIGEELGERLEFWSKHANKSFSRKEGLKELHGEIARRVQNEAVRNYENTRVSRGKGYRNQDPGKYRRFSGGAMLRTLKSPALIQYDRNTIRLFNKTVLDEGAAQWYRLNFGAAPRGRTKAGPTKPMTFFGVSTGVRVNLDRFGPSEPFFIPVGYWSSTKASSTRGTRLRAGSGAFYPAKLKPKPSANTRLHGSKSVGQNRGIHGTSFLDKSLTVLNNEYPRRLETLVTNWMESGL